VGLYLRYPHQCITSLEACPRVLSSAAPTTALRIGSRAAAPPPPFRTKRRPRPPLPEEVRHVYVGNLWFLLAIGVWRSREKLQAR